MAIDTAEKRHAMVTVDDEDCLPLPNGANLDTLAERALALGIYAGFESVIGAVGASSGSRQRWRRLGLIGRV